MEFEAVFFFFGFGVSVLDDPNDVIHGLLTRMPSFHISKTFATYPAMCVETTHSQECISMEILNHGI